MHLAMTSRSNVEAEETSASSIVDRPICDYSIEARLLTSRTVKNSGGRFWRCAHWQDRQHDCGFFVWLDSVSSNRDIEDIIFPRSEKEYLAKKINLVEEKNTILLDNLAILKEKVKTLEEEKKCWSINVKFSRWQVGQFICIFVW
ncbi:hypothetical protein Cni_G02097 [Canna indica]|uniref:GRF-type domain-containing protein n=1 Tax=Canna indica TaxID=4628 RepID=A0AAQ3Q1U9_9LILI|nr:hypothetical protein Cni_G02097 [Canna indica]